MRVQMDIVDDTQKPRGWFAKPVPVKKLRMSVEFSEEEKLAIDQLDLLDLEFFAYPIVTPNPDTPKWVGDTHWRITVRKLVERNESNLIYERQVDALDAMNQLEAKFRVLKEIMAKAETPNARSIEL